MRDCRIGRRIGTRIARRSTTNAWGVRQEEHDEREQVRREEREDRKQAREDERETRRRSP
jgi:hypothetical protein